MMPAGGLSGVQLAGELGSWDIFLAGGGKLHLAAHAYSLDQDEYVFVVLAEGNPRYEVELARVPKSIVIRIQGG
jgi:hypothetical protein